MIVADFATSVAEPPEVGLHFHLGPEVNKSTTKEYGDYYEFIPDVPLSYYDVIPGPKKSHCRTISGPKKRAPCLFPFIYKRKAYTQCTTVENHGKLWCATKVDTQGEFVLHEWGNCGVRCPTDFYKEPAGKLCPSIQRTITSAADCRVAAGQLNLTWIKSWDGPGYFPKCFFTYGGPESNNVYFNLSPKPSTSRSDRYGAICGSLGACVENQVVGNTTAVCQCGVDHCTVGKKCAKGRCSLRPSVVKEIVTSSQTLTSTLFGQRVGIFTMGGGGGGVNDKGGSSGFFKYQEFGPLFGTNTINVVIGGGGIGSSSSSGGTDGGQTKVTLVENGASVIGLGGGKNGGNGWSGGSEGKAGGTNGASASDVSGNGSGAPLPTVCGGAISLRPGAGGPAGGPKNNEGGGGGGVIVDGKKPSKTYSWDGEGYGAGGGDSYSDSVNNGYDGVAIICTL